jgi:hypothetical protein
MVADGLDVRSRRKVAGGRDVGRTPVGLPRRLALAIAAKANCDPRTVQRHFRGEAVLPAIADAIDAARSSIELSQLAEQRGPQ